ncbi:MAG: hypothetical protein HY689_04395 [Chloroflexi bacterium]|nr:hypothetical protein [Chloroflexota bacterium]
MARSPSRFQRVSAEITASSSLLREVFAASAPLLERQLPAASLALWAEAGAALVRGGAPQREAAAEYFRTSPAMAQVLTPRRLLRWARTGCTLAEVSGGAAAAYYRVSPHVAQQLPHSKLGAWASMGQRLCTTMDAAETLARRFFDASPRLVQADSLEALDLLVDLLARVAPRSLDLAVDVLALSSRLFSELDAEDLADFLGMGQQLVHANLYALRSYLDAGSCLYVRLSATERPVFLDLVHHLAVASPRGVTTYLAEAARHLAPIIATRGVEPLALAARIAGLSTPAGREFIRNMSVLTAKLSNPQLADWCRQGEQLLAVHETSGIGYFQLQSREALEAIALLSPVVELDEVREVLRLYCQALMGRTITILAAEDITDRGVSWTSAEEVDWEGTAIFVPSRMQDFDVKAGNFEAYKVLATHQAGHLEFGTFDFAFDRQGDSFFPLRSAIATIQARDRSYFTEFERFFDLFVDRRLAHDVFTIAEDTRIDRYIKDEYRGIRRPYRRVQEYAAAHRPELMALPLREHIVEILVRMSLEQRPVYAVPGSVADRLWVAAGLVNLLRSRTAAVEDAAEATIRLYTLLRQVPNRDPEDLLHEEWVTLDLSDARYDPSAEDPREILEAFLRVNQAPPSQDRPQDQEPEEPRGEQEQDYRPFVPVPHRGDLKPELSQAIQKLQRQARREGGQEDDREGQTSEQAASLELLQDWAANLEDLFQEWGMNSDASETVWPSLLIGNLLRGYPGQREDRKRLVQPELPHLGEPDVQVFTYDEWDYRAKAYRPKWCQVRQRMLAAGQGAFFDEALARHRGLVSAVRRQFEMLRPEHVGKVKRLVDGEEFDLDAVVDARVERRAGHTPSDKIYWRRHKVERDVAVALLLDMSLSTDERIERDAARVAQAAQSERARRAAMKRIIDLEREGLVLFIEALEQIGDAYGIYGFSGSGRDDVQFYIIKDVEEPLSDRIKQRIDRIAPLQGTRMGPAIRHTITKLGKTEARTKILIVLSDGRPQDRDYGTLPWDPDTLPRSFLRPGDYSLLINRDAMMWDEKEYAVHDTKQALNEAKAKNITPFCISVDKQGHDYLKTMCGDIGYEVVSDIESLPRRLPSLYRKLTT